MESRFRADRKKYSFSHQIIALWKSWPLIETGGWSLQWLLVAMTTNSKLHIQRQLPSECYWWRQQPAETHAFPGHLVGGCVKEFDPATLLFIFLLLVLQSKPRWEKSRWDGSEVATRVGGGFHSSRHPCCSFCFWLPPAFFFTAVKWVPILRPVSHFAG